MTLDFVTVGWELLNSFTGSTYISAFVIFVACFFLMLLIFQGDFELALIGSLIPVFLLGSELPWLKIMVLMVLGLWASYRIIDILGQRGG